VTYWADATNTLGDAGHFGIRPTFAEFLKTAKFDDVELRVDDVAGVVHKNADFGVTLNSGHGINDDSLGHK
jgi:hypothetical protein